MNDNLTRGASELVREGRQALRPTDFDKARILAAIQSRLAAGEVLPQTGAPAPMPEATAGGIAVGKLVALTAGVLAAVTAFLILTGREPEAQPEGVAVTVAPEDDANATSSVAGADLADKAPSAQLEITSTASTTSPRSVPRATESDRLAEEVSLLTRAEKEFHTGNFKRALAATDEHRQKFPKGVLVQERVNLRMQVLCGMGRQEEAGAEAKRLDRLAPGHAMLTDACRRGQ